MGTFILINDVSTEAEDGGLLVGSADPIASRKGNAEADIISTYFFSKIEEVDIVFSSDADRVRKLVHKLRISSKDNSLTSLSVRRLEALRERNFGILNGTHIPLESDLFSQTRIKAERGESIFECRVRMMKIISDLANKYPSKILLAVSHPFSCQIAFNAILQRDHTLLTKFWQEKGSFAAFQFSMGDHGGVRWELKSANNAFSNISYTQDEIYSRLLGRARSLPR